MDLTNRAMELSNTTLVRGLTGLSLEVNSKVGNSDCIAQGSRKSRMGIFLSSKKLEMAPCQEVHTKAFYDK